MRIPGSTPQTRAIRIAGLLAELGVQHIELWSEPEGIASNIPLLLQARVTDLPSRLLGLGARTRIAAPTHGLTVQWDHSEATWAADSPEMQRRVTGLLGSTTPPESA